MGLLEQGIQLMLVGMGTVFAFLTLLVLATLIMSSVVRSLVPELPISEVSPDSEASSEELAAIAAAVHLHRARDVSSMKESP